MIIISVLLIIVIGFLLILNQIIFIYTDYIFRKYLLSIGDDSTSKKLWLVRPIFEMENIMEKRFEETDNISYLNYSDKYRDLTTKSRMLAIILFASMILYAILTSS